MRRYLVKIAYWGDIACPYSYIGETNMRKALAALDLPDPPELEMRAYELDVNAGTSPHHAREEDSEERNAETVRAAEEAGKEAGLDIRWKDSLRVSTRNAHRLIKMAEDLGGPALGGRVAEDLYKAYFTENLDVAAPSVLLAVGEKNGIGREETEQMLNSEKYLDEVLHDEHEAQTMQVTAVPFFLIDDKYAFTGALSVDQMSLILKKIVDHTVPGDEEHRTL